MRQEKLIVIIMIISFYGTMYGQSEMPLLHSNNFEVDFEEGLIYHEKGWTADPKLPLDEYTPEIFDSITTFSFYSDIDSITFRLRPNSYFDFAIVINQKDTAFTRISTKDKVERKLLEFENNKLKANGRDEMYLELGMDDRPHVKGTVNESKEIDFLFDTGASITVINEALVNNKTVRLSRNKRATKNQGSDGVVERFISLDNKVQIGDFQWGKVDILPINYKNPRFDGGAGWKLFEYNVVELNYTKDSLIIHDELPEYSKNYRQTKMRQINGVHYIELTLVVCGEKINSWFEFDTGFSKTLNINYEYSMQYDLYKKLPIIYKDITSGTSGKDITVDKVMLTQLNIADYELYEIPVSLVSEVENGIDHNGIIGNLILKRFDLIIDYKNNILYLKPNKHLYSPIVKQKN